MSIKDKTGKRPAIKSGLRPEGQLEQARDEAEKKLREATDDFLEGVGEGDAAKADAARRRGLRAKEELRVVDGRPRRLATDAAELGGESEDS